MNARDTIIAYLLVLLAGLVDSHAMGRLPVELPSGPWRLAHRRTHDLPAVGDLHLGPGLR